MPFILLNKISLELVLYFHELGRRKCEEERKSEVNSPHTGASDTFCESSKGSRGELACIYLISVLTS